MSSVAMRSQGWWAAMWAGKGPGQGSEQSRATSLPLLGSLELLGEAPLPAKPGGTACV